jgi:LPS-assembly lipoprotein
LVVGLLAGCGFQLRGTQDVPFNTLYIPGASGGIALDLKRNIEAGTDAKVVSDPKQADAILELSNERRE